MTMIQYTPYVLACAGAYLLLLASITRATGLLYHLVAKLIPASIGGAAIWFSALSMMGGA